MPAYVVKMKADLENIKQMHPLTNNEWKFDIQSTDGKTVIDFLLIDTHQCTS